MNDFLWHIVFALALANWFIYILMILPKIRSSRTIYLKDWGFGTPFKNLIEYKELCKKDNESLIWFKIQVAMIFSFIVFGLLSTLV